MCLVLLQNQRLQIKEELFMEQMPTRLERTTIYESDYVLNDPPKMVHRSTKLYPLPANQRALLL